MCGIWFYLGGGPTIAKACVNACVKTLEARGPEGTHIRDISGVGTIGFTRLAINGLNEAGMQPMQFEQMTWVCNGEIYNWRLLAEEYGLGNTSGSDCEILGELYDTFCDLGIPLDGFFRALDGVFALVIVDQKRGRVVVGRDPYGVRPLYCGFYQDALIFGSEIKSLPPSSDILAVCPGHYHTIDIATHRSELIQYHAVPFLKNPIYTLSGLELAMMAVRGALTGAVRKRLMMERPVAALLSGGVDSSLIAALVAGELRTAGAAPLHTFSIGMKGSSDLMYAQRVASWIGSIHHEIVMTPEEFFAAVPQVIHDIESYDTTTVRASVGNWLVAKAVAATDCKVVFNGDGADEIWGSYLYFYGAPSDHAFEEESRRLLKDIHMFDVLRSDRCISSHGLEPRTPFLDKQFVAVAQSVATVLRRPEKEIRCEKWLMRKAFDTGELLPHDVLWRRKEAFSDGVSGVEKSWYQITQEMALAVVGPDWAVKSKEVYDVELTAEQFYYRSLYDRHYKGVWANTPYLWMPRWSTATDPSARTLATY